jgi:hypothetical protein
MKLNQIIALFISVSALAVHSQETGIYEPFKVVVGAQRGSDIFPCSDYAAKNNIYGEPYKTFQPEYKEYSAAARWITRHEGMDFCAKTGTEVIAPASGEIVFIRSEDSNQGGFLTIKTNIKYSHPTWTEESSTLYVFMTHITPKSDLKVGQKVTAGDVIAVLEPPGKPGIGARSHVHMQATPTPKVWLAQTDPNQFWQKSAGKVTCFDAKNPPTDQQMVAPLKCK